MHVHVPNHCLLLFFDGILKFILLEFSTLDLKKLSNWIHTQRRRLCRQERNAAIFRHVRSDCLPGASECEPELFATLGWRVMLIKAKLLESLGYRRPI
jgi:hypothetical protein